MPSAKPYYLTTAIDYVNAPPHLGHAYEKIAADVIVRFQRLRGKEVFFLTGTDEHGIKIEKTAQGHGVAPKAYADEIVETFKAAWDFLDVRYNRFIRTTDADHYAVVAHLWRTLLAKGDIYKASYTGQYCTGCETFLTQRDLTDEGLCRNHQRPPEPVAEENYFFKLSQYKEALRKHLEAHPDFVQPDFRREEVLHMLDELEDISVSRSVKSVTWGIPVPDDPGQVIYVWIDALSNYITGIGFQHDDTQFQKFWPADVHVIGKDILRFHAIYWPAMLLSAGVALPKTVFAHGFITLNDAKISKSLGNVVSPQSLAQHFELTSPDPIRYYLMTTTPFGQDGNFSMEDFKLKVNADLANNLGNLLNRALSMTEKYFDGQVPAVSAADWEKSLLLADTERFAEAVAEAYEHFAFHTAADFVIGRADAANKLINESEPWNLFKSGDLGQLARVMVSVLEALRQVAIALYPITPTLAQGIWEQLGCSGLVSEVDWDAITEAPLPAGQQTQLAGPLLPRLESEIVGAAGKK